MRALRWPAVAVVLLAGLVVATAVGRPAASSARSLHSSSLPVTSTTLVCPNTSGSDTAPTTMTVANVAAGVPGRVSRNAAVRQTPLTGSSAKSTRLPSRAVNRLHLTATGGPTLLEASGPGAGAVVADQNRLIPRGHLRGLLSAPCLQPATDWWIAGADGRVGYTDTLLLANPGSTSVNVTVTAWSQKGPIQPPRLESYSIPARTAQLLPVARYAPDAGLLTLHVHANTGRLVSAVSDRRVSGITAAGLDWIAPTLPPSTDLVVPGFVGGAGARRVILTDPGERDATVALRVSRPSGSFVPAGHQSVVVRAGHSTEVDLTSSLGTGAGAVILHSDQPIAAAGLSVAGALNANDHPDIQFQAAARAITNPAALSNNTPPFDRQVRVYVTAPELSARLRVTTLTGASRILSVRGGRTLVWDPVGAFGTGAYGALVFTHAGGGPVYVSRTLYAYGVHGALTTAEQPTPLPATITLPPAVPDERVAVPGTR